MSQLVSRYEAPDLYIVRTKSGENKSTEQAGAELGEAQLKLELQWQRYDQNKLS